MRHLIVAAVGVSALVAAAAPAGAATTGTIRGRVVNQTTGDPQAGVRIVLTAAGPDIEGFERVQRTDRRGRYEFDDLPTGDDHLYVIDARYSGGIFPGSPVSLPSDTTVAPVIASSLKVWETSTDPSSILVRSDRMFVVPSDGRAAVVESVQIVNPTDRAYIGRGGSGRGDADEPAPSLAFSVPVGTDKSTLRVWDASMDIPELLDSDLGFAITTAIPPGRTDITFVYSVEGLAGTYDLSKRALYPIAEYSIFTADPLVLDSDLLSERGRVTLDGGKRYTHYFTDHNFDAGDAIPAAAIADAGLAPLVPGAAAAAAIVVMAAAAWMLRRRRAGARAIIPDPAPQTRDDLLVAIARLDHRHDAGDIGDREWSHLRAELKSRLIAMQQPEHAR